MSCRPHIRFRAVAKESLHSTIPIPLATQIREQATRQRRSLSSVVTEHLCIGLGIDPAEYGIGVDPAPEEF